MQRQRHRRRTRMWTGTPYDAASTVCQALVSGARGVRGAPTTCRGSDAEEYKKNLTIQGGAERRRNRAPPPVLKKGGSISSKKKSATPEPSPPGGDGALATALSLATTVADSKLFNTYLHAAIVVFIAG